MQDAKNRQKFATLAPSHNSVVLYLRNLGTYRQSEKLVKLVAPTSPHNIVEFGPLAAKISWRVWGTPANFNGFRVLAALLHGTRVCDVEQRALPTFGRAAITLGIGPHSSVYLFLIFF